MQAAVAAAVKPMALDVLFGLLFLVAVAPAMQAAVAAAVKPMALDVLFLLLLGLPESAEPLVSHVALLNYCTKLRPNCLTAFTLLPSPPFRC
jgi:hypothetical protein